MTRPVRFISALGAVFFALTGLSACGGIAGDAVVQVGGTPITKTAFEHWMGVAATSNSGASGKSVVPVPPNYTACIAHLAATVPATKGTPAPTHSQLKSECATQYKSLSTEVLSFLISSQWVISEAGSLGVKLSDSEVKKQFTKIRDTQFQKAGEFEKFLATSGQTISDLLLRVKLNLLSSKIQQKIVKQKSTVSQAQIEKYYHENPSRFGVPEKRNVDIILTKSEAAAKGAKAEVQSGKSFASVAKKVSIDPTSKATGGLLTEVVKGQQEKALDEAIFSAKTNVLSGPIKTAFGYYVFDVKSISTGSQQSLAQVHESIKSQLIALHQQEALSKFVKAFRTRWMGKTDCRSGFVVADCKQYKKPKTTSTTPEG